MNPYEVTKIASPIPRRWCSIEFVIGAGLIGYAAPFVAGGLLAWCLYGWPVGLENLQRVFRMHREVSLNSFVAFVPNIVLALILATAASKVGQSSDSNRQWWIAGGITIIGYTVVAFVAAHWNFIPWTWSSELTNVVRTALVLIFPVGAYAIAAVYKRWTRRNPSD